MSSRKQRQLEIVKQGERWSRHQRNRVDGSNHNRWQPNCNNSTSSI